jgi:polyhydroxyalkanoate synthase
MSDERQPAEKVMRMMAESAQAFSTAIQTFMEAAARTSMDLGATGAGAGDPARVVRAFAERWGEASGQLGSLVGGMLERWFQELPEASQQSFDAQTFSQLRRLAQGRLQEEIRRLGEVPAELIERMRKADPQRLATLLEGLVAEYQADLQALKESAFSLDLGPLAEGLGKLLSGARLDERAERVVRGFLDSLAVKARYGAEYYADPRGTPVGQTPREMVRRDGRFELYRYQAPAGVSGQRPPVLLVYSVINKPYILDLVPGFSFVEHLLSQGLDVYLIEWGETRPGDRDTTLDSYIEPGIHGAVEHIRQTTGVERVPLFGHCIGGNLALLYAALHPERVARLVTLTTPITAAEGGVVAVWTDREVFPVRAIVDAYGHMPAKLIRYTFMALKPYYEVVKLKMFIDSLGNPDAMGLFLPVDRWANENVDIPGAVFQKFVEEVFHADRFRKGETVISGRRAELKRITCPVLNLAASRDWIVPPKSAAVLGEALGGGSYEFVLIEGAHVGIMIDPRARPLWTRMSDFLKGEATARRKARPASRVKAKAKTTAKKKTRTTAKAKAKAKAGISSRGKTNTTRRAKPRG